MEMTFNPTTFGAVLAFVGPLLVGMITGLKTSSKVKAVLAIVLMTLFAVVQAYMQGGITSDLFGSMLVIIAIWQSSYAAIWKPLGMTSLLQATFPIAIGAGTPDSGSEELPMVDEDVPVQTDNSTRADDGSQNVVQDPSVDLTEGEEIPEVL